MKFSVITTSYNMGRHICTAIESAYRQRDTVPAFEHIVVDSCSTDETPDVLAAFPHLNTLIEKDRGIYDGMNKAIARANGDVIVILNADDVLPPGALKAAQLAFETSPADIIAGGYRVVTGSGTDPATLVPTHCPSTTPSYKGLLFGVPAINARYIGRHVFNQIGPFDLRLPLSADRHWLIRAHAAGISTAPITDCLYVYRSHDASATLSGSRAGAERIYREHLAMCDILEADGDASLRKYLASFRAMETYKLAALQTGDASAASGRISGALRALPSTALAGPGALLRGALAWRQYRGRHSDT